MISNSHCPHHPEPGFAPSHRASPPHRSGPRTPGLSSGPTTHSPPTTGKVIKIHDMIIINNAAEWEHSDITAQSCTTACKHTMDS